MSLEQYKSILDKIEFGMQTNFIQYNYILNFFAILGLTLIEVGSSRHKNSVFIIMKNIIVISTVAITWWVCGAAFAVGKSNPNNSIGVSMFVENNMTTFDDYNNWYKAFTQCLISTLIAISVFSERGSFLMHIIFTTIYSGVIFPIGYFWTMNHSGWLKELGFIDPNGSAIVHMSGAVSGLAGVIILKSRKSKGYILKDEKEYYYSSKVLYALGALLFWYSNIKNIMGTDFLLNTNEQGRVFSNSIIASATACLLCFLIKLADDKVYDVINCFNGLLSGVIAIKAGADSLNMWQSFIIGGAAGAFCFVYLFVIRKFIKPLDDSRLAFATNYSGGSVGIILLGFLHLDKGLFYQAGGKLLGCQFLGLAIYTFYPFASCILLFLLFKLIGLLDKDTLMDKQGYDKGKLNSISFVIDEESAQIYSNSLLKKQS